MAITDIWWDGSYEGCMTVDGHQFPATMTKLHFSLSRAHNVALYYDGVYYDGPWYVDGKSSSYNLVLAIPADGLEHKITLVDDGRSGTPAATSGELRHRSTCNGVIKAWVNGETTNSSTNEKTVSVEFENTRAENKAYTCRVLLDGSVVSEMSLNPGASSVRNVTVPADNKKHIIKGELKFGSTWAADAILWYPVQANGGAPPPPPPPPTEEAVEFIPGETVLIESKESSTPLATDGTEWVLMEIAPKDTENWRPIGAPAGLVYPDEDGQWAASIPTNATDFPSGTSWTVRARHFRNFASSAATMHTFTMKAPAPPPVVTLAPPVILGPVNRTQRGGTWLEIYGTGTPGARVEFMAEGVSGWGSARYTPETTTVSKKGRWRTYVYGVQRSHPHNYSVIGYRARLRINGQYSDWSNRLDVTWRHHRR